MEGYFHHFLELKFKLAISNLLEQLKILDFS